MTLYQDNFDNLLPGPPSVPPWVDTAAATPAGNFTAFNGILRTDAAPAYLVYSMDTIEVSVVSSPGVTLDSPHGYAPGEPFQVALVDGSTIEHHSVVATSTTVFQVATATAVTADAVCYLNKKGTTLTTGNQEVEAVVFSTAEGASSYYAAIWARWDPRIGPVLSLRGGYGLALFWELSGVRSISLLKVDPENGGLTVLATKPVTVSTDETPGNVFSDGTTDLGIGQHLRLVVFDEPDSTDLSEPAGVVIRGFLNQRRDDVDPTIEITDRGRSTTGLSQPLTRTNGTFALTISAASAAPPTAPVIAFDSFVGRDNYSLPSFGVTDDVQTTLAALKARTARLLSVGGATSHDETLVVDSLNGSLLDISVEAGDKAYFRRRLKTLTITADTSTKLVTLPREVDRLIFLYDGTSKDELPWRQVGVTSDGRQQIYVDPFVSGRSVAIDYIRKVEQLVRDEDVCTLPSKLDELICVGAAVRISELQGTDALTVQLQKRHGILMGQMKQEMSQIQRQRKPRFQVSLPATSRYNSLDLTGFNPFV